MPRFPVNFRRKSTAAEDHNAPVVEHSFRVLDRSDASNGKSFDGGHRLARLTANTSKSNLHDLTTEDNLFAGMKNNRGSGSSTTKTASDNSSRHSNASTAPSSTDYTTHEDWRNHHSRKPAPVHDVPAPPAHRNSTAFLKQAGRTFSFGGKKTSLPTIPAEEPVPSMPSYNSETIGGRSSAETASTVSTTTPPKVEDSDFMLDLGGDLTSMLNKFDKRTSVAALRDQFDKRSSVTTLKERNLTAIRANQPSPLHLDHSAPVEAPQHSWTSQTSDEGLLGTRRAHTYHNEDIGVPPVPPLVPKHETNLTGRRGSSEDDEDTTLLRDSIAATQYLSDAALEDGSASSHYRRDGVRPLNPRRGLSETYAKTAHFDEEQEDDNMFGKSSGHPSRVVPRVRGQSSDNLSQNKVMTPDEFEKYRRDKVQEERMGLIEKDESEKEEDDNYDDEEDDIEKSKEMAKQRRKQEAHMTVYRQQMMKVTGESSNNAGNRASIAMSMSTPNLPFNAQGKGTTPLPPSDGEDEDEEIPLAILAAHGFPNKNRPPTRIDKVPSNPNLRASMQPSYSARPASTAGDNAAQGGANGGHLPPFARKLPQDPYLGAGLINQPPRESFALGGGMPSQSRAVPTGGLVGVIASEERSRALRRGSPAVDGTNTPLPSMQMNGMPMNGMQMNGGGGYDPMAGVPPQMMYPMGMPQMPGPSMTPSDQAQLQMTQQMTQFMQMQMQFMQMMASQNQGQGQGQGSPRGNGHMPSQSMGSLDMSRNSFLGDPMAGNMRSSMNLELPRFDSQRTMSMVQPSSNSWLQQPPQTGYAPSIHAQGGGYAPSIAPSERSNIGLPGRYRPVSSVMPLDPTGRTSTMSGALPALHSKLQQGTKPSIVNRDDDDDDEEGWEAMKAKREKKKSIWRSKKDFGSDIGALIS